MISLRLPSLLNRAATSIVAVLALVSCGEDGEPPEPPVPPIALEAVVEQPGTSREALARAVHALFTRQGIGETRAVIVMHDGKIVAERYAENYGPDTRFQGWSMSKTVTGVLIGMLVADGRLALDDPAPIEMWQRAGDPRGEITLRHLLQMRSGLRHEEKAEPVYTSGEVRMMFLDGRDDMAAWAEAQPLDFEPGTQFAYSTPTAMILADIATDLAAHGASDADERQQAMATFLEARMARPLGMASLTGEYDASGTLMGGSAIWANARDWAIFGEFLRRKGVAQGVQVVPRGWIGFMTAPSPVSPDYGAQIWLNRPSGTDRDYLFADQGPVTAFAAIGHLGQYVIVLPEQQVTIVRLGKTDEEQRAALVDTLAEVAALYSGR